MQIDVLDYLAVFTNVWNTQILHEYVPAYQKHFWCMYVNQLNDFFVFIVRNLQTQSRTATDGWKTLLKRKYHK